MEVDIEYVLFIWYFLFNVWFNMVLFFLGCLGIRLSYLINCWSILRIINICWCDKGFLVKDVVLIIINIKDKLVFKVLFSCKEIKIFVVDISKLEYIDDIRFYEFGVMKNERV